MRFDKMFFKELGLCAVLSSVVFVACGAKTANLNATIIPDDKTAQTPKQKPSGKTITMHSLGNEDELVETAVDSIWLAYPMPPESISRIHIYPDSAVGFSRLKRVGTRLSVRDDFKKITFDEEYYDRLLHLVDGLFFSATYPIEKGRFYTGIYECGEGSEIGVTIFYHSDENPSEPQKDNILIDFNHFQKGFSIDFSPEILELFEMVKGEAYIPRNE